MSGDLAGRHPRDTYRDLLQISNGNEGVDGTLRAVEDGGGEDTALDLSTTEARVRGNLTVTGSINAPNIAVPVATASVAGKVKIGTGVSVTPDGTISVSVSGTATDAQLRDRSTHTGSQAISTVTGLQAELDDKADIDHIHPLADNVVDGFMSAADKLKLTGIAAGATANSSDALLRDRNTHTGTQIIGTVAGLQTALDGKAALLHDHATASGSAPGFMSAADKLKLDGLGGVGNYTLPPADIEVLGGVKIGQNILFTEDGTISVADPYSLPPASSTVLGGVKVGDSLTVAEDGKLEVVPVAAVPVATASTVGLVKPGTNLTVAADGTLNATTTSPYTLPAATASVRGGLRVQVGNGLNLTGDLLSSTAPAQYVLPTASASVTGGIRIGTGLAIDGNGVVSATGSGTGGTVPVGVLDVTAAPYSVDIGTGKTQAVRRANLTAINTALADALVNGFTVYVPPVTIEIEALAVGANSIQLVSGTWGGVAIPLVGYGAKIVQFTSNVPVITSSGVGGRIEGLTLSYNTEQTTGNVNTDEVGAILLNSAHNYTFENLRIERSWIGILDTGVAQTLRNKYNTISFVRTYRAGIISKNGANNIFNDISFTNEGTTVNIDSAITLVQHDSPVVTQTRITDLRAVSAIKLDGCLAATVSGIVVNAMVPQSFSSTDKIAGVFHWTNLTTGTVAGMLIRNTNFSTALTTATRFKFFATNGGSDLDVTDLTITNTLNKNTTTQTAVLVGPITNLAASNRNSLVRMRNVRLDRDNTTPHWIDLLSDIIPDTAHDRKNVGLLEYNSIIGPSEGLCVDFGVGSAPIYPERHGTVIQVADPLLAAADFTLSNRTDTPYGAFNSPLLSRGATMKVIRHPSATGNFSLNIKNHNGTQLTALSVPNTAAELLFDGTNWRVQNKATF